jgi:hypothetical protein
VAIALRVCDVDFLRRRIELHRNVVRVRSQFVVGSLKSNKNRTVVVPAFVMTALAASAAGKGREELLWTAPYGGYLRAPGHESWLAGAVARCQAADETCVPHSLQNLAVGLDCAPQQPHNSPVALSPPPPSRLGSTSVSFHRLLAMSVISPCHHRDEVSRPSNVVCFKTPVFGPYHADLSWLRWLGVMAVAAPVLEQLTLALAGFVVFVAGMSAVAAHHETVPSHHIALDTKNPRVKSWGLSLRDSSARGGYPRRGGSYQCGAVAALRRPEHARLACAAMPWAARRGVGYIIGHLSDGEKMTHL